MELSHLLGDLDGLARAWLAEDTPSFDYGGAIVGADVKTAALYAKSHCILSGRPFFDAVFRVLNCRVEWLYAEGATLVPTPKPHPPTTVATVHGRACDLLRGERVALNMIARASGIATVSRRFVDIARGQKWGGTVAGTRKTTPGFRLVEKYAMKVGGADTHRMDLSSMIMIKDNHIASRGSISEAVRAAKSLGGFSLKVEVECANSDEALVAIEAGADIVMLDNLDPKALATEAKRVKELHPHVLVEGSGGLTEDTLSSYMSPYVDILSTSAIHQGVPHADFSLKIKK